MRGTVTRVETADDAFPTEYVVAATKSGADHLADLDGVGLVDRGRTYVDTDGRGRTGSEPSTPRRDGESSTSSTR